MRLSALQFIEVIFFEWRISIKINVNWYLTGSTISNDNKFIFLKTEYWAHMRLPLDRYKTWPNFTNGMKYAGMNVSFVISISTPYQ